MECSPLSLLTVSLSEWSAGDRHRFLVPSSALIGFADYLFKWRSDTGTLQLYVSIFSI